MEYKISELLELIEEDTVRLERRNDVSPQKIKETVMNKIHSENKTSRPSRRWGRTLLIAAIISAFFAVSAFAIGYSIHRQRQQELREKYHIDQTGTDSYVEYPLPEDGDEAAGDGVEDIRVTPLSAVSYANTVDIYFNVSPIDFRYVIPDEDCIELSHDGEHWVYAEPVYSDLAPSGISYADITQEHVLYDAQTRTATMHCYIHPSRFWESGDAELTVRLFPDDVLIGRFTVEAPELEKRLCLFDRPLVFSPEGYDESGRVLGIELSATGVWFLVEMEDFSLMDRDENTAWIRAADQVTRGTLHMADGSDFSAPGCDSIQKYENGIAYFYCNWQDTIDIHAVTAITIGDTSLQLN
ncbi:MAG TPA: hypothetical protein IAC00_07610 [Candidatus Limivicinus faecipullorum]|nr:hypothetical protein [Candidatus Limivicinus faecipullorum]